MFLKALYHVNLKIYKNLGKQFRSIAAKHVVILLLTSFSEILFLALLYPSISWISKDNLPTSKIIEIFQFKFSVTVGETFLVLAIMALWVNFLRVILVKSTSSIAFRSGEMMNVKIANSFFQKDFFDLKVTDVDGVLTSIVTKVNLITSNLLQPSLTLISNVCIITFLSSYLFWKAPVVALFFTTFVAVFFAVVFIRNQSKVRVNAINISRGNSYLSKLVRTFRPYYTHYYLNQKIFDVLDDFLKTNHNIKSSEAKNLVLTQTPRFFFEGFLLFTIFLIVSRAVSSNTITSEGIAVFVLFLAASTRLLPLAQQTYFLLASARNGLTIFQDIEPSLGYEVPLSYFNSTENRHDRFSFCRSDSEEEFAIKASDLTYEMPGGRLSSAVNFTLRAGDMMLVHGASGVGKSSLMHALLGLLPLAGGRLDISAASVGSRTFEETLNFEDYLRLCAYLPQDTVLFGYSLEEFLCHNNEAYDEITATTLLTRMNLPFVGKLKNVLLGEFGDNLSGGERQRVALARVLLDPTKKIIFLDEFTSGLDPDTEEQVFDLLCNSSKDRIIVIISHGEKAKQFCNLKLEILNK